MAVTWGSLAYSAGVCGIVALISFFLFNLLRQNPKTKDFFAAKRKLSIPFRFRPPKLNSSFLGWMKPVFTLPDAKFAAVAGFDALTYMRFLGLAMRISGVIAVISASALLPTHYTSSFIQDQLDSGSDLDVSDVDKWTMSNVKAGDNRLYVHTGLMIIFTIFLLKAIWSHYAESVKWRMLYLAWSRKGDSSHTVFVTDIPGTAQGTLIGRVYDQVDGVLGKVLPGSIKKKLERVVNGETVSKVESAVHAQDLLTDSNYDVYKHDTVPASQMEAGMAAPSVTGPAPSLSGRNDLSNFVHREAPTDFETWEQAENALHEGLSVESIVRREFARNFGPNTIQAVSIVHNESKLSGKYAKYMAKKGQLLDLADTWITKLRAGKEVKRKMVSVNPKESNPEALYRWGQGKKKIDEMEYKLWELEEMRKDVKEAQSDIKETSAGFVTLSSRMVQSAAATGMLSYNDELWLSKAAPSPSDIIWPNASFRGWERSIRNVLGWVLFCLLIFFFTTIVAFVQQLVNLNAYAKDGNWAATILDLPVAGDIIQGIIPTLGLTIVLIAVPILIKLVGRHVIGLPSLSGIDFDLGKKYYMFLFFLIYIVNTLIGAASTGGGDSDNPVTSIYDRAKADGFSGMLEWIGTAVPQQASFFLSFMLTKNILAGSIAFLRVPGVAIYLILSFLSGGKRKQKRTWSLQFMSYGAAIPNQSFTLLLALGFCLIQPLVPIIAFVSFAAAYFYARYDLLYVKREAFQSGGLFWPVIFDQIYSSVIAFQIIYIALFGIKEFAVGSAVSAVCLIVTIIWRRKLLAKYERPMTCLSIHAAADFDRADLSYDWMKDVTEEEEALMKRNHWDTEGVALGPIEERYVQPALVVSKDDHDAAICAGTQADRLVRAAASGQDVASEVLLMHDEASDEDVEMGGEGAKNRHLTHSPSM